MNISKFTQAVIARNAPHLDEQQLAALLNMGIQELDRWARSLDDSALADLAIQLQEWEEEMKRLIAADNLPWDGSLVVSPGDGLKVWARRTALGERLPMPTTGGYRAKSPEDAASRIISGRSTAPGAK